ncbi:hypothetical protein GF325_16980 [Candidatus Bathyarchaeota archaeon]|nr:hypothetical protein [Candidatus Bathyarchaeota archaeon]
MKNLALLFSTLITPERCKWLQVLVGNHRKKEGLVNLYLTGNALHSMQDARIKPWLLKMIDSPGIHINVDHLEASMLGISSVDLYHGSKNLQERQDFWHALVKASMKDFKAGLNDPGSMGFLLLNGPYMSRSSVHALRCLQATLSKGISPELYLYLDGVHSAHVNQKPSEFENIGASISQLHASAMNAGLDPWVVACTRCAAARGYEDPQFDEKKTSSIHGIPSCRFVNLNRIIERFTVHHPILSPDSGYLHSVDRRTTGADMTPAPTSLVLLVTHPPYGSEHAFGAISMAVAAACNHGIDTKVVFIEDGIHCVHGKNFVSSNAKLMNIQEIIMSTIDIDTLSYYYHVPSMEVRGLEPQSVIKSIFPINAGDHDSSTGVLEHETLSDILDPCQHGACLSRMVCF